MDRDNVDGIVWVGSSGGCRHPGLVITERRSPAASTEQPVGRHRAIVVWHLDHRLTTASGDRCRYRLAAGGGNVSITARPDLSLSDWPKPRGALPRPVTTVRTPWKRLP